jgi:DNA repair protein RadC
MNHRQIIEWSQNSMPPTDINIYTLKQIRTKRYRYDLGSCQITCPLACYKALQSILDLRSEPVEKFGIFALNTKNEINGIHIIGSGTINNVNIRPREVFLAAMMNNAESIICFHNHPSGDRVSCKSSYTNRCKSGRGNRQGAT